MIADFEVEYKNSVLMPEGDYEAVYVSHAIAKGTFGSKVSITFRIVQNGEAYGHLINGWYNVKEAVNDHGRAILKLSMHSKLARELFLVLGIKHRRDRLSPALLKGYLVLVRIITVKENSKKEVQPEALWYSKVGSILEKLTDSSITVSSEPNLRPIPEPNLLLTAGPELIAVPEPLA